MGIPRPVVLARLELDFNDLATSVVNGRADDETLLAAVQAVVDGDDVPGVDIVTVMVGGQMGGHITGACVGLVLGAWWTDRKSVV